MNTSTPATVLLRLNSHNRSTGEFEALTAQVIFQDRAAAEAFVATLPKTAQRRVFVRLRPDGTFSVLSDGRTYEKTALVNFRRFAKAALGAGFNVVLDVVAPENRVSFDVYAEESDIKAAFGIA